MTEPLSCTKCGNLLAVESASGLCPACAPAAEPATHSFPAAPPAPDTPNAAADPTPPAPPADPDPHAPTHTAPSDAVTASVPGAPDGAADPLPPNPVGFTLICRIGKGGMGEVFRAHEHSTNRFVALKTMDPKRATGTHFERFQLEFCALANIEHPHIVRVFKDDFHHKPPFFTMEELEGGTVSARLRREDPDDPPVRYAPRAAVQLIRKVASAVQALHDYRAHGCLAGVIHRDIKPGNILLTAGGEPKLADFGLVKYLDAETITPADVQLGTPAYMPPEQCAGQHAEIGYAADVYGLGATLYHMLTGEPPFRGMLAQVVAQVLNTDPRPVCELAPQVDEMLGRIVRACMHKRPEDRYQTVNALIADLDAWLNPTREAPPTPPEPSIGTRAGRWAKRNAVALAACALVALGGVVAALWPKPVPADPRPNPWEVARADLRAGNRAILIPATGDPATATRVVGSGWFAPDLRTGDICYFSAIDPTAVDLIDDPGIDSYRIRYQMRHAVAPRGPVGGAPADDERGVGVYFGRTPLASPAGDRGHAMFRVTFRDIDRNYRTTGVLRPQSMHLERGLVLGGPQRGQVESSSLFASCSFLPATARPGNWYTFEIDVRPNSVSARVYFHASSVCGRLLARFQGPREGLTPADAEEGILEVRELVGSKPIRPADEFTRFGRLLDTMSPQPKGLTVPQWTSRAPVGLWANNASLNVRNCSLFPLN